MKLGVLAEVQAVQVETESFNLNEKRINQRLCDADTGISHQALAHQTQIMNELFCFGIAALLASIRQGALDPLLDVEKKKAVAFSLRIRERIAKDRGKGLSVFLQCSLEFQGNRRYAGRGADQPPQLSQPLSVVIQDEIARHLQRSLRASRIDKRIAVAVSADPRAKRNYARQLPGLYAGAIFGVQRAGNFFIHLR